MPKISFRDLDSMDCTHRGVEDKDMTGSGFGKLPTDVERRSTKNKDKEIKQSKMN